MSNKGFMEKVTYKLGLKNSFKKYLLMAFCCARHFIRC